MKVSIVIPYWNGEEKIKKHLPGVIKFARKNGVEEIIASDDGSTDKTVELLKTQFPDVTVVEREKNEGFSSNVNTGFSRAKGDFIFLLNSDASVGIDVLKFALPHFEDPKVFSIGCKVGNGFWATGEFREGFFWHGQGKAASDSENIKSHLTLWAGGGSSIFRKSIWDELGGLDTIYNPFYEEDVDLGYRATKRGFINIWEPKALVEHYKEVGVIAEHFSKNRVTQVAERNHLMFIWKNITSEKLFAEHKEALIKMLTRHPKYWGTFLAALSKVSEIKKRREVEKREAKLTDEEVFELFKD